MTTLQASGGRSYPPLSLDPEGLVLTKDGRLVLTSEGFATRLIDPFLRFYDLDGRFLGSLPVPSYFLPTANGSSGVRNNLAFEPAGVPPNGRFFFTGTENAVDGLASLAGSLGSIRPAQKTLLLDRTLGTPLDNVDGMTFGPDLPDGRRSLVMVSDNNFAASQFTQFLLFAVSPS